MLPSPSESYCGFLSQNCFHLSVLFFEYIHISEQLQASSPWYSSIPVWHGHWPWPWLFQNSYRDRPTERPRIDCAAFHFAVLATQLRWTHNLSALVNKKKRLGRHYISQPQYTHQKSHKNIKCYTAKIRKLKWQWVRNTMRGIEKWNKIIVFWYLRKKKRNRLDRVKGDKIKAIENSKPNKVEINGVGLCHICATRQGCRCHWLDKVVSLKLLFC